MIFDHFKKRNIVLRRFLFARQTQQFIENLAMLLSAGIDVLSALKTLEQDSSSRLLARAIADLQKKIEGGVSISSAMEEVGLFPRRAVALIRLGESSGRLAEHMQIVADQQERENVLKGRVRSALLYVSIVFSVALVVGMGIAWYVLPQMASVFSGFEVQLPLLTRIMLRIGIFLDMYGNWFVPLFFLVVFGVAYVIFGLPTTQRFGQFLLLRTPGIGQLLRQVEVSRFGHMLGTMIQAGISPVEAIDSLREATSLRTYRKLYAYLQKRVEMGESFRQAFVRYPKSEKMIPRAVQQMIFASEQSGALAATLLTISTRFENKAEEGSRNVAVLIEPILLVVVGLIVGLLALAIFLPIYNLSSSF